MQAAADHLDSEMLMAQASFHCDFVAKVRVDGEWMAGTEIHPADKIYLVTGGKGRLRLDCGTYDMHPGRVMIYPAGTLQQGQVDPRRPLEKVYIHFRAMTGGVMHLLRFVPPPMCLEGQSAARMIEVGRRLVDEWDAPRPGRQLAAKAMLLELLLIAYRAPKADHRPSDGPAELEAPARNRPTPKQFDTIRRALAVMAAQYGQSLSVASVAEQIDLTPTYFSELFKRLVGCSPMAFLQDARMRRAQELLARTDQPVADIAGAVGYRDPNYFSRAFQRHTGQSPTAYRDSLHRGRL